MTKKWWTKFFLLIFITLISVMYIVPTFTKVTANPKSAYPFTKKINLGLDLQGGLYLVMGVDFNKVFKEIADRQLTSLNERFKEKSITVNDGKVNLAGVPQDDPRIQFTTAANQKVALKALLQKKRERYGMISVILLDA